VIPTTRAADKTPQSTPQTFNPQTFLHDLTQLQTTEWPTSPPTYRRGTVSSPAPTRHGSGPRAATATATATATISASSCYALDQSLDASILDALACLDRDCGGFSTTAALPTTAPPLSAQEIATELGLPPLDTTAFPDTDASPSAELAVDDFLMADLDHFAFEQLDELDELDALAPVVPDVTAAPPVLSMQTVPAVFDAALLGDPTVTELAARLACDKTALALAEKIAAALPGNDLYSHYYHKTLNKSTTTSARAMKKKRRKPKVPVPEHMKDEKYYRKREANTQAARRTRERERQQKAHKATATQR